MIIRWRALTIVMLAAGLAACETLPSSGPSSPTMPSSTGGVSMPSTSGDTDMGTDGASSSTSEERRAVLDRRLDDSLGEFDKTLQEEQRRTAEQRDTRTASTSQSGEGAEGAQAGTGGREGDLRSERSARNDSRRAESGDRRDRGDAPAGSGSPDRGIPPGDDDDIVARRLRRAAEQETDPELKEKLWKEYADYKRNVQGRG